MPRPSRGELAAFLARLPEELAALEAAMAESGARAELDRSYASLDAVEHYVRQVLPSLAGQERKDVLARVACYVGQTVVERAGGEWALRRGPLGRDEPCVVRLPELGKHAFRPQEPVSVITYAKATGLLRECTELYDLPHRRARLAALLAAAPEELAAFAEDVRELSGQEVTLDHSLRSIEPVGVALARLYADKPPRARLRQVRDRAVLYVGGVVERALGGGTWSVCNEPIRDDFGSLTIEDWAPESLVGYVPAEEDPGAWLREMLEREIEARRRLLVDGAPAELPAKRTGTWLVMCRRERLISPAELAERLARFENTRPGELYENGLVVTAIDRVLGCSVDIDVTINTEPYVVSESEEIAELHAEGRPDAEAIAKADARYELLWDLARYDSAYNTLCVIGGVLAEATGGVVFDATDGRIV